MHEIVIMCAGEPLSRNALTIFNDTIAHKGARLINLYGSSETAVYFTMKDMTNESTIKIGTPFSNTEVLIVDESNKIVPTNTLGRILVKGESVFTGYLNIPNKSKFIEINDRFYFDMGDLGKIDHSDELLFFGRADNQIQLRGVRIELEEIEMAAKSLPYIKNAIACVVGEDDNKKINLIIQSDKPEINKKILTKELIALLPSYMLPSTYYSVKSMPNLPSGKIDRKGILNVESTEITSHFEELREQTVTEKNLICIISRLLNITEEKITYEDSFFRLGGNSILLIRLLNIIETEFDVRLSIPMIFERSTIEEIAEDIATYSTLKKTKNILKHSEVKSQYLMSDIQQRMYLSQKMKEDSSYNVVMAFTVEGVIDIKRFISTLNLIMKKHTILRTAFKTIDGEYYQVILPEKKMDIVIDVNSFVEKEMDPQKIMENFVKPFNLEKGESIRAGLIKRNEAEWLLILDMHHIVTDDLSNQLILQEISEIYNNQQMFEDSTEVYQYVDFSENRNSEPLSDYWKEYFSDLDIQNEYRFDESILMEPQARKINKVFYKKASFVEKLSTMNVSTFSYFASCFAACLRQAQEGAQVVFGMPLDQRHATELSKSLGMYSDSIPMIIKVDNSSAFDKLLSNVDEISKGFIGQSSAGVFNYLSSKLQGENKGIADLFSSFFVFNDTLKEEKLELVGTKRIKSIVFNNTQCRFDMTFIVTEEKNSFSVEVEFNENIHKAYFVENFMDMFISILDEGMENLVPLNMFESINNYKFKEQKKYIHRGASVPNRYSNVIEKINEICESYPDEIAIRYKSEELSFRQMDEITSRAASFLVNEYDVFGKNVAIYIKRSIPQILAIISILKAGAAYVPISEEYPIDRIQQVLEDLNPALLLTDEPSKFDNVNQYKIDQFEEIYKSSKYSKIKVDIQSKISPDSTAYVMFTSGTTGKPKGVQVLHRNLLNLNLYFEYDLKVTTSDTILQYSNIGFDGSVWEIFMSILNGATLQMIDKSARLEPEAMDQIIKVNKVTIAAIPSHVVNDYDLSPLRMIINGGTLINYNYLEKYVGNKRIINSYGPTECTVAATHYEVQRDDKNRNIPIGKPNPNIDIFIMEDNRFCDVGEVGEIWIGGLSTSQGYIGNENQNRLSFVLNEQSKERYYKTGDLGSWDRYGNLVFHGRKDDQIKMNGYRIELEEIRSCLLKDSDVEDAVVLYENNNHHGIFAFLKSKIQSTDSIRDRLFSQLPDYMIPSKLFIINEIPLTPNGKPDKINLVGQLQKLMLDIDHIPKKMTLKEEKCYSIIGEVLGFSPDISKSCAENGGDSLVAMRIISSLKKNGYTASIRDLLKMSRLEQFISSCSEKSSSNDKEFKSEYKSLGTPIMAEFKNQNLPNESHFNQMLLASLDKVSSNELKEAIDALICKHDALRISVQEETGFNINNYNYLQYSFTSYELENLCQENVTKISNETSAKINISQNKLIAISFIETPKTNFVLLCIHHLLVDVVSWGIILDDLDYYLRYQSIPSDNVPFGKIVNQINELKSSKVITKDLEFWNNVVSKKGESTQKKGSFAENVKEESRTVKLSESNMILLNNNIYTVEEILIASAVKGYSSVMDKNLVQVMLENHGRLFADEIAGITDVVGWFTAEYPINFTKQKDLKQQIEDVQNRIKNVPNKGVTYNILKNSLDRCAVPDMIINYLGEKNRDNSLKILHEIDFDLGPMIAPENYKKSIFMLLIRRDEQGLHLNLIFDVSVYSKEVITKIFDKIEMNIRMIVENIIS